MSTLAPIELAFAPWRLSGVVIGALLNEPAMIDALGDAVQQPPYKAAPRAPVLGIKPRNTHARSGAAVEAPADIGRLEIGATLGIVIGRSACRVSEAQALAHVAGYTLVADLYVPHASHYRPAVRQRARDNSCLIGPRVVPAAAVADPDALDLRVSIDGRIVASPSTAGRTRSVARLLQDVSEFMTLQPGDLLLLGAAAGAPQAAVGSSFAIENTVIGRLQGRVIAEAKEAA